MRNPNPEFWHGRRVFLTGHTGFKGGWLAAWLNEMGAVVRGYALEPPTEPNLFSLCGLELALEHQVADIRDLASLQAAIQAFKPEIVLHLAAQPIVRYSFEAPVETYDVNVMGTVHLLEAVRKVGGVRATIIVTSDKCYENRERIWAYREYDAMGGFDPYSSSKGCAELVTAAYARSYFTDGRHHIGSVRAGNVIGGGDWAKDRLIADVIRSVTRNEQPVIRRPRAVRPWQHVLEPLSGYLLTAEHLSSHHGKNGEPDQQQLAWNFGPGIESEVDVETVARSVCRLWGSGIDIRIETDPNAPHEAAMLKLDSSKAHHELAWRPRWSLDMALEMTVDWYKRWHGGEAMAPVVRAQIQSYLSAGA
jgi:CDP-glucose 4,6-dehydratase